MPFRGGMPHHGCNGEASGDGGAETTDTAPGQEAPIELHNLRLHYFISDFDFF